MATRPPSERVTMAGVSESGKTYFLARTFLLSAPRLLIIDRTGEWAAAEPYAPFAAGLNDLLATLEDVAGKQRWRVIASLSNDEVQDLATRLLGIPDIRRGYSYNVGGMGLVLSEVDLLVPVANAPEPLRSLWRRGSHAGLSIYADTQRPSNVSKEVTSQCRWIGFTALYEPADTLYMHRLLGASIGARALRWIQSKRYRVALRDAKTMDVHLIDADGSVYQTDNPKRERGSNAAPEASAETGDSAAE